LAEFTLRFSDDSAKLSCQLGQEKTKKKACPSWFGRVGSGRVVFLPIDVQQVKRRPNFFCNHDQTAFWFECHPGVAMVTFQPRFVTTAIESKFVPNPETHSTFLSVMTFFSSFTIVQTLTFTNP
jgi:hypothetical protein